MSAHARIYIDLSTERLTIPSLSTLDSRDRQAVKAKGRVLRSLYMTNGSTFDALTGWTFQPSSASEPMTAQ